MEYVHKLRTLGCLEQKQDSRCLEQIDPPVGRAQVEDVGPLAVVGRLHGQGVVDGHGVLQVLLRELLIRPVLPLTRPGEIRKQSEKEQPGLWTPITSC